jgi:hypothetical protein
VWWGDRNSHRLGWWVTKQGEDRSKAEPLWGPPIQADNEEIRQAFASGRNIGLLDGGALFIVERTDEIRKHTEEFHAWYARQK